MGPFVFLFYLAFPQYSAAEHVPAAVFRWALERHGKPDAG
jgi:hypothetical protein